MKRLQESAPEDKWHFNEFLSILFSYLQTRKSKINESNLIPSGQLCFKKQVIGLIFDRNFGVVRNKCICRLLVLFRTVIAETTWKYS